MSAAMSVAAASASLPLRWRSPEAVKPFVKFLPVLRAAVAAAPERADLKLRLVHALFRTGAVEEIVDRMRSAVADRDADAELLTFVGRAAIAAEDHRLAADALRPAAAKGYARALGYLAQALHRLERADEALAAGLKGLQRSPADFESLMVVARVLFDRGEVERLWALCDDLRARGARGTRLSAVLASAAAALGRKDEVDALVDPPGWFSATQLAVLGHYNSRLAAELLALRSTDNQMRIDELERLGGPMTQDLLSRIREAVQAYVAQRQDFSDHPMVRHRPEFVALHSWLIVIHHHQHHTWHIHQAGWISGVYYVSVPKVEAGDDASPGAIEFGLFPFGRDGANPPGPRWRVMPQAGSLLLFPSYYAHRTWPTGIGDPRVCVAFDVRPFNAPDVQ